MKKLFLIVALVFSFNALALGASGVYDGFMYDLAAKAVDMDTDTCKVALLNNSHTFTAADDTWANVSGNEVSGTGYTAGGATMAGLSITEGVTFKWDATDVTWGSSTITAYHAVIYDTSNADSLVCSIDFGGAKTATDGDFKIQWHANGIITISD